MAERPVADRLSELIDAVIARPDAPPPAADAEIAPLLVIAVELCELPDPDFKKRLKADLQRRAEMSATTINPIREGFHTLTPYIMVRQAAELIDFVKQAFGAEATVRGIGSAGGLHCEARIGDSMLMLGGGGAWQGTPMPTAFHYYVPNVDEVYERALRHGATSLMGPTEDYGDRFACVKDAFGNEWYISTHLGPRYVPEGLRDVTIYLHPTGAPRLIDFLKQAFGAEEVARHDSAEGVVGHAKIRIGDSIIEMGEAHGQWQPMPTAVYMFVPDADAVYRHAVDAGATSLWEPTDQPYGDRNAGVQDPFGNQWFIATHIKDVPLG
jgi:PhnB protein